MKQLEAKVVVEFNQEEASILGNWVQWEIPSDLPDRVYALLKELGGLLLPENEQD